MKREHGQGNIFKPTYVHKGVRQQSSIWWARWYAQGREHKRSTGTRDEKVARRVLDVYRGGKDIVRFIERRTLDALPPRHQAALHLGRPAAAIPHRLVHQPIVYAWAGRLGVIRYVGMSRKGLERPVFHKHHARLDLDPTDVPYVWSFPTIEAAMAAESRLILGLRPGINHRYPHVARIDIGDGDGQR